MSAARAWTLASLIVVASWQPAVATAQAPPARLSKERVTFKSGNLTLVGFLFKPDSGNSNPPLRDRLVAAVRKTEIPVFVIQPPKDASLEPARVLGVELQRRGPQHAVKVYPPDLPADEQWHCFGGARGMHVWAQDALGFFAGALR